jgi:hypothetical protein
MWFFVLCCCKEVFHGNGAEEKESSLNDNVLNAGEAFYLSFMEWKELIDKDP